MLCLAGTYGHCHASGCCICIKLCCHLRPAGITTQPSRHPALALQVIIDCTASSYVPQFYRRWMEQVRSERFRLCFLLAVVLPEEGVMLLDTATFGSVRCELLSVLLTAGLPAVCIELDALLVPLASLWCVSGGCRAPTLSPPTGS